jgi:GPH family glycoside/pentoside/hexuronide:cation symporter
LILCGFAWVAGCVATAVLIAFGSMMMDAADEHEFLFGSRREGLYFAGLVFSGKAAIGAGFIVAGVALDLVGFPKGIANGPTQAIPPGTIVSLGLVAGPGAALISLTSVAVLMRYRLLKNELSLMQAQLAARRATAGAS